MALFTVTDFDRQFYKEKLQDFLPEKIIDVHTHVWLKEMKAKKKEAVKRTVSWPSMVAADNSAEDLMETYKLMFPDKKVTPVIFTSAGMNDDMDAMNAYIAESSAKYGMPALLYARPDWSQEELAAKLDAFPWKGIKVYLNLSPIYIPEKEIRIFDFLTPAMLDVVAERKLAVMLHIPRDGRLKDPVNVCQIQEICRRWPDVKLIIAHIGRAYCNCDVGDSIEILKKEERLMWDFAATSNAWVMEQLIRAVGPKRIMFGSDMPILRLRTRRIEENGKYINIVPKGVYGDVSADSHMRESEDEEFTFFMYREIEAFRAAAEATGLSRADIEDVFCNNACRLFDL
ncbi:MAG: amidohydrolase family protein [Oscillospiraceae bacterium]|nr:amidohydrolase family protein [Oscillospiraceae bacterium]